MNTDNIKKETTIIELLSMSWIPVEGKKAFSLKWNIKEQKQLAKDYKKGHNIAIRTGKSSGCLVLDIDTKNRGLEVWTKLEAKMGKINTYRVTTGTGGLHLYFNYKGTESIGNLVECVKICGAKIGIDTRNDNGYVVAAPSVHPDTSELYKAETPLLEWNGLRKETTLFEPLPDWIRSLITGESELDNDCNIIHIQKAAAVERDETTPICSLGITYEWVEKVLDCLDSKRADDYDDWRSVVFALRHTSVANGLKLKPLAHLFSKQSKKYAEKSGQAAVDSLWKEDQPAGKRPCTLGTIRFYAKADDPEVYKELCKKH